MAHSRTFYVTATHPTNPIRFNLNREPFVIYPDSAGGYYSSSKLGCGKTYPTAYEAIVNTCADHALTIDRISESNT